MRTARLPTVHVSVVCQYLCISGEGEGEVGPKEKKFEHVYSDDHQMPVVGEYCIQVPCPEEEYLLRLRAVSSCSVLGLHALSSVLSLPLFLKILVIF